MYEDVYDFQNLLAAYQKAIKYKRYKRNIVYFSFYLENNLFKLRRELLSERYLPSTYVCFTIYHPKIRKIAAPSFRDRVLQHSLFSRIRFLFESKFIYDSYACRRDIGTHFAMRRTKKFLQAARSKYGKDRPIYCLRMDIKKYFSSISWDILLSIIDKTITCEKTKKLIEKVVTQHSCANARSQPISPPPDVVNPLSRQGVPIGNLTSQLFANIYLNELDHYIKEVLCLKWYGRYMDDFMVIHPDKDYLKKIKIKIEIFLDQHLHLQLHPKKVIIQNVNTGIPFVGYRIFYDHVLVRGKTLLRIRQKLKAKRMEYKTNQESDRLRAAYSSIRGHLVHANTYGLQRNLFLRPFPKSGIIFVYEKNNNPRASNSCC